jgi:nucleoid DNA-binding protein
MTKFDIVRQISTKTGVEHEKVRQVVQLTLDGITDVLVAEGRIELRNFGIFEVRMRKAKLARNPKNGAAVKVPSHKGVSFHAGKEMEEKVAAAGLATLPNF